MQGTERKAHWEHIYTTKALNEVSWYQPTPQLALNWIQELNLASNAAILDVGGGDSFLVDHLLELGYNNITVLDISEKAIARAKERLGTKAQQVTWVVSDITLFTPEQHYEVWHDRAAFHFLSDPEDIKRYYQICVEATAKSAHVLIGTFSTDGPLKCSGIPINQYTEQSLSDVFKAHFDLQKSTREEHPTPFNTYQNFVFCAFKKSEDTQNF